MLRQKPGDRFDVLRRCSGKQNPGPLSHPPKIFVIIEEYNNDLRMKFRTEMIDHDRPRVCLGTFISLNAGFGCRRATLRQFLAGPDVGDLPLAGYQR
jgi:hypothetical protein